jgi:eukaryotic-like serine/threonine-protein kinase
MSTDAARWERIKSLFQEAFDRAPADRGAYLDAACGADAELRGAVERLLEAHASAGGFLDAALDARPQRTDSVESDESPAHIGSYRVIRELGRGGMGAVYLAERGDPGLRKTVAIKVVQRDSHFMLRRFRTETQILSGLEHPGIARLYDGGTTADGLPYFVMEYVPGTNILAYCDARGLPVADRLTMFCRICAAVQHAHQSFIVHRDLKPSNILVTNEGNPKLLDFGIAKLLNPELRGEDAVDETIDVARLLTPQYASPEHLRGKPVSTASDVYSLGVILYELLTGQRPYRVTGQQSTAEIERIVCENEAPPPSSAAPPERRRTLRGDLDNIVLKALRKDAHQRYATAAELAGDLRRYLEGFPVVAQPDRVSYRAGKFVRRHRAGVAAAAIAAVSLVAGLAAALWQARVADRERRTAERRFQEMHTLTVGLLLELPGQLYKEGVSTTLVSRVVQQALGYLDRLAAERQSDRGLSLEVASGYRRMGELQGRRLSLNLGDRPAARASLHKARTILEPLARSPQDAAASRELATVLCDLARIEDDRLEWSRRCVDAWQTERRRFPADHDTGLGLATAYELLADAMGGDDNALQMRQQAASIYDELLVRFPGADDVLSSGALNHRRIGWAVYMKGDWPAMLRHVRQALDMDLRDLQIEPANSGVKVAVGLDHHMLGCYYWGTRDYRSSRQALEEAVRVQREAYERDPRDEWVQSRFLHSYGKLGFARDLAGDAAAAADAFRDALTLLKRGHPIDRDPVWQGVLGFIHAGYGRMLWQTAGPSPEACEHLSQGAQSFGRVQKIAKSLFPDERYVLAVTEQALAHCSTK